MQTQLQLAAPDTIYATIGIIRPLEFPFLIYINIEQLIDPEIDLVYFFVYSMGAKKMVAWGTYDKRTSQFEIDGSCRYNVRELSNMIRTWRENNFNYLGNAVKDRFTDLISSYLGQSTLSYDQYLEYKFLLAFFQNKISQTLLQSKYPDQPTKFAEEIILSHDLLEDDPEFNMFLQKRIHELDQQIRDYEMRINRVDLNINILNRLTDKIQHMVHDITQKFYDNLKFGQLLDDRNLQPCPSLLQCFNQFDPNCSAYYYGNKELGYLSDNDEIALL